MTTLTHNPTDHAPNHHAFTPPPGESGVIYVSRFCPLCGGDIEAGTVDVGPRPKLKVTLKGWRCGRCRRVVNKLIEWDWIPF